MRKLRVPRKILIPSSLLISPCREPPQPKPHPSPSRRQAPQALAAPRQMHCLQLRRCRSCGQVRAPHNGLWSCPLLLVRTKKKARVWSRAGWGEIEDAGQGIGLVSAAPGKQQGVFPPKCSLMLFVAGVALTSDFKASGRATAPTTVGAFCK